MKRVSFFLATVFCSTLLGATAQGQQLLVEDFNYPAGDNITAHGWTAHSSGGTNPIKVSSSGLTYAGYTSSGVGNAAALQSVAGEDDNRTFTSQTSGSVYAAFMINVSAAQTTGAFFAHFNTGTFIGRVWIKKNTAGSNFAVGVSKQSSTPNYTGFDYAVNTTYLLVLKYTIVAGSSNDTVALFINPALGGSEPSATISAPDSTSSGDASSISAFALRQDTASSTPALLIDGIRIGKSWESVTGYTLYRSAASGDWNSAATWETSYDGVTWSAAATAPTSTNAGTITVRSPHNVTVTANVNADQLTVEAGAQLTINSGVTLTLDDGAGTDLSVNGMVTLADTGTIAGAGSFALNSGATLATANVNGITSGTTASGSIQAMGGRVYDTAANYTYNGSTAQSTGSGLPSTVNSLSVNNSSGVTLSSSTTVNGMLALVSGNITTDSNTLALGASASVVRTSGHVVGAVKKSALAGGFTFPVGTAAGYTPVELANATGGGELTVRTVATTHPNVNASASLKEYWTLTAAGSLTADMTFNYLQADVQGDESSYRIIRVSNGTPTSFPQNCPDVCVDTTNNKATIRNVSSFSDWTLGQMAAPTAVRLATVRAEAYAEGVLLAWDSAGEAGNLGYNIYREKGGRLVRVNRSIVAGSALTVGAAVELRAGQSYNWWDARGSAAARYWIEDMDVSGRRTMHGPFAPAAGVRDGEKIAHEYRPPVLLEELNAKARHTPGVFESGGPAAEARAVWPEHATSMLAPDKGWPAEMQSDPLQRQWEIAAGLSVKIGVRRGGWYRVTQPELVAAGLDPAADPRLLQLYVEGRQIPIRVNSTQTSLSANGSIEFYGRGLDTPSTDMRVYWLIVGAEPGLRINSPQPRKSPPEWPAPGGDSTAQGACKAEATPEAGDPAGNCVRARGFGASSFAYTVESKERLIYFSSLLNGDAENYFGRLISAQPVTQNLTARNLAAPTGVQSAWVEVALQGISAGAHTVRVSVNGVEVGKLSFDGTEHAAERFALPAALVREGENAIGLAAEGADSDLSLVDYLRLTYAHKYAADANLLRLSTPGKGSLLIDGFTTPNVRVVDVTDPEAVFELAPHVESTPAGYAARVVTTAGRMLLAFTDDLSEHAASVAANRPSEWHGEGQSADLLIITHGSLLDSVAPLVALRESQGLRVAAIDVEDLYDEFAYGAHAPQAVKDFLRLTTLRWRQPPRYVLFAGDATVDPRNYTGRGDFDLVPTKLVDTASMETASDEWFADFDGAGVAAVATGRLPVRDAAEAAAVVSKIVNFDPSAVTESAVLVSDQSGANDLDFAAAARALAAELPRGTTTTFINRADGPVDAVRARILDAFNAGPAFVNFTGHGSTVNWTGAGLLRSTDAAALTNDSRLSLFTLMTCLNGYFHGAALESLAESLLKAPRGGAVAVWASSGVTMPFEQQTVSRELYRQLSSPAPPTIGDAVRRAKLLTGDQDIRRTWILFGDPSMRLR